MRMKLLVAGLAGLFIAAAAPAQEPASPPAAPPQEQVVQPAPEEAAPLASGPAAESAQDQAAPPAQVPVQVPAQDEIAAPAPNQPAIPAEAHTPAPTPEQAAATVAAAQAEAVARTRRAALVAPAPEPENIWYLDLSTGGRVAIQLRPDAAPAHVERIKTLTRQGFYNGLTFHRVIEGFMAQGGDPTGTGGGGSDLPSLTAERGLPHLRGAVAMARTEAESSGDSQFYIMLVARLTMDRSYTVFGRVIGGMNFVDAIERGEPPVNPTRIVRASIASDNVPLASPEELRAAGRPPQSAANATMELAPAPAQAPPSQ